MPSVLSVAEARAFLPGSPLSDAALQLAIDDIESEIVARFGAYYPGEQTERIFAGPDQVTLILRRRIESIVSIVEDLAAAGSPVPTRTLDPTDYRIRGSFFVDRLRSGANPARAWSSWGNLVVYVPANDTASRKVATVDVLKVEVAHSGFTSRRIGDYSESTSSGAKGDDVSTSRDRILRRLRPKKIVLR